MIIVVDEHLISHGLLLELFGLNKDPISFLGFRGSSIIEIHLPTGSKASVPGGLVGAFEFL
jgi:hypothetical protein